MFARKLYVGLVFLTILLFGFTANSYALVECDPVLIEKKIDEAKAAAETAGEDVNEAIRAVLLQIVMDGLADCLDPELLAFLVAPEEAEAPKQQQIDNFEFEAQNFILNLETPFQ